MPSQRIGKHPAFFNIMQNGLDDLLEIFTFSLVLQSPESGI